MARSINAVTSRYGLGLLVLLTISGVAWFKQWRHLTPMDDEREVLTIRTPLRRSPMTRLLYAVSMSLDGFIAGINQSPENPMGDGGEQLGEWMRELAAFRRTFPFAGLEGGVTNASTAVFFEEDTSGAMIMGRNMFGGGPGSWGEPAWDGPWGGNPFHVPVFVLTHHPREPLVLHGDPPFTFVTEGIGAALEMAQKAAPEKDVLVGGGANAANQYLAAGLLTRSTSTSSPCSSARGFDSSTTLRCRGSHSNRGASSRRPASRT